MSPSDLFRVADCVLSFNGALEKWSDMDRLTEEKLKAMLESRVPGLRAVGDRSGLAIRITASGASWQLRYRHAGKPRWITIGKYPEHSLKEAQKRAVKERARIFDGVDPVAERRRAKLALKAAKTFRDLADDYQARALADLKPSTQKDVRRYLNKDVLPRLGHLRIEEVTQGEIVRMVEQIAVRSLTVARRAFIITSVVFSHAQAKSLTQSNPCASLKLSAMVGKKKQIRPSSSLSADQLSSVLSALPGMERRNALAIRIILACAVRKGEMRMARREHLDLDAGVWTIPAENAKNGKEMRIPLAPVVVQWFRELLELGRGSAWVLPGVDRIRPISDTTINAAVKSLTGDVPHFTIHDLRRTARTHLGKLGVDIVVAEKCLNHSLGGLIDAYDRGDYFEERREALQLWADFLVGREKVGQPVVPTRR